MEKAFAAWRRGRRDGKPYRQATINKAVECLKSFYRWLFGLSSEDPAPEAVRWLKKEKEICEIRPEDLWTEEDVTKVLNATESQLYKTLISVAYESGLRPGELRGLKLKDIQFVGDIVRIYCRGKTAKKTGERVVPLIRSYDILKRWVYNHPRKDDPNAWLWTFGDKPLPERNFSIQLQRLARKVGLKKPAHPYILRHTALTRMYKALPTAVARRLAGHTGNSQMVDVYCHLAMSDLENSVRRLNGLPPRESEEQNPLCPECRNPLPVGALECLKCGAKLSTKSACELDEESRRLMKLGKAVLKRVEENPEILDLLLGKPAVASRQPDLSPRFTLKSTGFGSWRQGHPPTT